MNGAITEPLVSTTSPPNTTIMTSIGNSQNFFRTRINRQSSTTKSIYCPLDHDPINRIMISSLCLSMFLFGKPVPSFPDALELVFHRFGRWSVRLSHDPVAVRIRLSFEPQQVLPHHAHDEAGRQNRAVEEQRHHNRIDHAVKEQSELQPYPIERIKDRGAKECRSQKQRG